MTDIPTCTVSNQRGGGGEEYIRILLQIPPYGTVMPNQREKRKHTSYLINEFVFWRTNEDTAVEQFHCSSCSCSFIVVEFILEFMGEDGVNWG
jgi:hypothetical protein